VKAQFVVFVGYIRRGEIFVHRIHQRNAVGNFQVSDFVVIDLVHGFHQRADRVGVRYDEHSFAGHDAWCDDFFPIAKGPLLAHLQTLCGRRDGAVIGGVGRKDGRGHRGILVQSGVELLCVDVFVVHGAGQDPRGSDFFEELGVVQ